MSVRELRRAEVLGRVKSRDISCQVDPTVLNPYHTLAHEYAWTDHIALQNPE